MIAPCSSDIVTVLIGTQGIQCIWLIEHQHGYTIKAYGTQKFQTAGPLTQSKTVEQSIRSFLTTHTLSHAFVALGLSQQYQTDTDTIAPHQLLQCQLIAINTPFHCAGISSYTLAKEYALEQKVTSSPATSCSIPTDDFLCAVGLYTMVRNQT